MVSNINETPKKHILGRNNVIWRMHHQNRSTGATFSHDEETKKERQRKKPNSGKLELGIRRDHPCRRIEMKFCLVGGLQEVVLRFKFYQTRFSGFGAVGVKICPFLLTWPLAYTVQQFVTSVGEVTF